MDGLIHIYEGNGKGKTTAGVVLRSAAQAVGGRSYIPSF